VVAVPLAEIINRLFKKITFMFDGCWLCIYCSSLTIKQSSLMKEQLLRPVYGPKDNLNCFKATSSGLCQHFDNVLEVSRTFLGNGLEFFPIDDEDEEEQVFMVTTPENFMLEDNLGFFDRSGCVMGFDPSLPCINENAMRQHLTRNELSPVHDEDLFRVEEARQEAYLGSSAVVDFRLDKGNTNIVQTCTFRPIEMDTVPEPFVVSEMSDGYAKRSTP
jgi:hypothetical protein